MTSNTLADDRFENNSGKKKRAPFVFIYSDSTASLLEIDSFSAEPKTSGKIKPPELERVNDTEK